MKSCTIFAYRYTIGVGSDKWTVSTKKQFYEQVLSRINNFESDRLLLHSR